jgi:hypothetical protein
MPDSSAVKLDGAIKRAVQTNSGATLFPAGSPHILSALAARLDRLYMAES